MSGLPPCLLSLPAEDLMGGLPSEQAPHLRAAVSEKSVVGFLAVFGPREVTAEAQTGWLKTTGTSSLTVPEARCGQSRCQQGRAPLRRGGENASLASSTCWWPASDLRCSLAYSASVQSLPPLSHGPLPLCLCLLVTLSYKDTSHSGVRTHSTPLLQNDLILTNYTCSDPGTGSKNRKFHVRRMTK